MSEPKRIQRKRTKGWRMPEGAVYVGRPTIFGNPFSIARQAGWPRWAGRAPWVVIDPYGEVMYPEHSRRVVVGVQAADDRRRHEAAALAVDGYREVLRIFEPDADFWTAIEGRDLACWCPLDQPCHADVLLELANPTPHPDHPEAEEQR